MTVASGQSVTTEFTTSNPTTKAAANADSLPTGTLYVNGTANAATVTVTNQATGAYKAAVTLPSLAAGDVVSIVITATVASVSGAGKVWEDACALKVDLVDAPNATAVTAIQAGLATAANQGTKQTFDGGLLLDYNGACRVAGSPTSSQIQLGTDASSADNWYNGAVVKITGGTGAGQARRINSYVGSTRMATVHAPWVTAPDLTSTVIILGQIIT